MNSTPRATTHLQTLARSVRDAARAGRWPVRAIFAMLLLLSSAPGLPGQEATATTPLAGRRSLLDREDLLELSRALELVIESPAYTSALRVRAQEELEIITVRLQSGDFDSGDQIELTVEGESDLTGTFVVQDGGFLRLPLIGDVSLRGALRGELEPTLTDALARFIRDPVVTARSVSHIAILGEVGQPGFHVVTSEIMLADAIMLAGGLTAQARLDQMRIERAGERIWEGEALQRALAEGQTLDRMSLRAGDQVIVPAGTTRTFGSIFQSLITAIPPLMIVVVALTSP